jgi:hypothetical protein
VSADRGAPPAGSELVIASRPLDRDVGVPVDTAAWFLTV